jgi:nitrogen fixation protein FixH
MQAPDAAESKGLTGRHMLALLCAFFGVVLVVNLTLVFFANSSWSGLVVKNSYVASQQYNGVIAAARRQTELGWQDRFSHDAAGLSLILAGRDGAPLRGLSVTVTLSRPTHEGEDRVIALSEASPGIYGAEAALAAGLWEARVVATAGDGTQWRGDYRYVTSKAK